MKHKLPDNFHTHGRLLPKGADSKKSKIAARMGDGKVKKDMTRTEKDQYHYEMGRVKRGGSFKK